MKTALEALLRQSLDALPDDLVPREARMLDIEVRNSRDSSRGDFASNLALRLAKSAHAHPRRLADALVSALPANDSVAKVEIAGSGFINFFLRDEAYHAELRRALAEGEAYGHCTLGAGRRAQVELVFAHSTGPLHPGHGRQVAFGDAVANLLEAGGFAVQRAYCIDDSDRPLQILALSTWLRYLALCGEVVRFPAGGITGDDVEAIARHLLHVEGTALRIGASELVGGLPPDGTDGGGADAYLDALTERARKLLGPDRYQRLLDQSQQIVRTDVHAELKAFGVEFDGVLSSRAVTPDPTEAPAEQLLCILGLEHHDEPSPGRATTVPQDSAPAWRETRRVQSVSLRHGAERMAPSTRPDAPVTLRDLRRQTGNDAARLFFVMRSADQPLDFDLQLATTRAPDNPVYCIQYAHARVASVFKQLAECGATHDRAQGLRSLQRLTEPQERALLRRIAAFPALLQHCAQQRAPHTLVHYLRELADEFHSYHGAHAILVEDVLVRNARLVLAAATQTVIRNGLKLLGVSAPLTV